MIEHRTKVCLLGANFSTDNLGVSALAWSALDLLHGRNSRADVLILDYHRELRSYDLDWNGKKIPVLNLSFSRKIFGRNHIVRLILRAIFMRLIPSAKLRTRFLIRNPILLKLDGMNFFAAVSGGDSFSDIYGLRRFFYMALPQVLVVLLGKPLVQLPQTYGPYRRRISRFLVRYLLNRSAYIYSRDFEGLEFVKKFVKNPGDRIRFCYDMAFTLAPRLEAGEWEKFLKKEKNVVGFNISGLLYKPESRSDFSLAADYRLLVGRLLRMIVRDLGAAVILVPHVYGSGRTSQSDLAAGREAYEELRTECGEKLYLLEGRFDQNGIKHIIGRLSFFAGSRMHSCIAALSQNIPAVGLAYSDKFTGVYRSIGMEDAIVDLRISDEHRAAESFKWIFSRKDELSGILSGRNRQIREKIELEFKNIFNISSLPG